MKALKKEYLAKKDDIKAKLEEFKKERTPEELFTELCFCLCTPMSKAEMVIKVINEDNTQMLLYGTQDLVENLLQSNTRFHKTKAEWIVAAREYLDMLSNLPKDGQKARSFLVKNIKGLGMKEASHFLRNIGYAGLAIIDGHILNGMCENKIIKCNDRPRNAKDYLKYEKKFFEFAEKVSIPAEELDLLLWSQKTGKIIK